MGPLRSIIGKVCWRLQSPLRTTVVSHRQLPGLLFGQQNVMTQAYFLENFGQYCTIEVRDFPHYDFLCHCLGDPFSDHAYSRYLACSWDYYYPNENTPERRREFIQSYIHLFRDIEDRRDMNEKALKAPLLVCRRPDGRVIIVDGNHRAAAALRLGLDVRATFVPPRKHLASVVAVPEEQFGTKRLGRPYQGLVHRGKELIKGRRRDIYERMQRIAPEDIVGKSVLDLGCNVGMNCYLAAEFGAANAVGVEASPRIATAAVRLNSYFAQPCCRFVVHDLNEELDGIGRFDTVFCFSLVRHLNSVGGLVATLRRTCGSTLYFEGHADTHKSDYEYLLNKDNFSHIELIGYGSDGVHTKRCTRPLFRCER